MSFVTTRSGVRSSEVAPRKAHARLFGMTETYEGGGDDGASEGVIDINDEGTPFAEGFPQGVVVITPAFIGAATRALLSKRLGYSPTEDTQFREKVREMIGAMRVYKNLEPRGGFVLIAPFEYEDGVSEDIRFVVGKDFFASKQ